MRMTPAAALAVLLTLMGLAYILIPDEAALEGFSYDSFRYLAGAESILRDRTYRDLAGGPQTLWPPGTSLLYAAAARISGVAPEATIRIVNSITYVLLASSLWLLVSTLRMRWWAAGATMAGILLNSAVLAAYRKLWSEPAVLGLLAAILFCVATAHDDRRIILATVVASIAILFRFAMLATIPFLCVAFAVKGRRKVLTALPLLAPVPWWIATWLVGVPLGASRVSSGGVVNWEKSGIALAQLGDQLLPSRVFGAATLVLVAASIAYAVYRERSTAVVSAGWILAYAAFLLVAQRIASPSFDLDLRILLPMYLGCVVALGAGANAVAARSRVAAAVLVLPLLLVPLRGARQFLAPATPPNAACLGREAVVAQARALAPRGPIATNAEGLIWYATRQAVTPEGSTKIWVAADEACPGVIDRPSPMPPKALLIARSSSGPP